MAGRSPVHAVSVSPTPAQTINAMTLEWRIGTLLEKVKTRTRAEKSNYKPTVVATHCLFGARQTIFPAENTAKQPAFSEIGPCSQDGFPCLSSPDAGLG